jgi:hypothetical protein
VKFRLEQVFPAPLEAVADALVDPAFLERLRQLPKLGRPRLLDRRTEGAEVRLRVQHRFVGELSRAVTRVVDPGRLTWVEELTYDRQAHRGELRILPDHYADRLQCRGTTRLTAKADGATLRVTEGDLVVHMPLVGRRVERAIVSGMAEHAELEVQVLTQWLAERGQ